METKQIIKDFIFSNIVNENGVESIQDAESLIDTGILDSLGIIKLLSFFESRLSVKVDNNEIIPENFESVNAISSFIDSRRSVE